MFYNFICSFLRSMGDSVTPLIFLLFSTVLNVGLDLLFILKFHWGVAGAAAATVSAQLISTVGCFCYAFAHYPNIRLKKEDWHITMHDVRRHVSRGIPLGLQFSVLAVGIIVMQGGVVQFDMLDGRMVSNAAQNGFGAANKLNSLVMTPMNALGTAMTSFTAQNLGAGRYDRIKKGTLQGMVLMGVIMALAVGIGMLLTIDQLYLHVFLSADKVTEETIRFGNSFLYVDFALYPSCSATAPRASDSRPSCWAQARRSWWPASRCARCCPPPWPEALSPPRLPRWRSTRCALRTPWRGSPPTRCCVCR